MTLVLGMVAADGLVLASDSQVTWATSGQSTRGNAKKLYVLQGSVACGISTDHGSTAQVLIAELDAHHDYKGQSTDRQMRLVLTNRVKKVYESQTNLTVAATRQAAPPTAVLFGCYVAGTPHLFEFSPNGLCTDHAEHGYTAIGSGDIYTYHAMASFAHHPVKELSLDDAKLLAFRIVRDAVSVAALGIGGDVQVATVAPSGNYGTATILDQEDLDHLDYRLGVWRTLEREALAEVGLQGLGEGESTAAAPRDPAHEVHE